MAELRISFIHASSVLLKPVTILEKIKNKIKNCICNIIIYAFVYLEVTLF